MPSILGTAIASGAGSSSQAASGEAAFRQAGDDALQAAFGIGGLARSPRSGTHRRLTERMRHYPGDAGRVGVIVIWNTWFDAPVAPKVLRVVWATLE